MKKEEREAVCTKKDFQNKMKMNFEAEEIRYKKLYNKIGKRERKRLDGYWYTSHQDWEKSMSERVGKLQNDDLIELSYWLKNKITLLDSGSQMVNTFALAFAAASFASMLTEVVSTSKHNANKILMLISAIVVVSLILWFTYRTFHSVFFGNVQKRFYLELDQVVSEKMREKNA